MTKTLNFSREYVKKDGSTSNSDYCYGTLKELATHGYFFIPENWDNKNVRVVIVLKNAEGSESVTFSEALSAELRAGKIKQSQLAGLKVYDQTNKEGKTFPIVKAPGGNDLSFANVEVERLETKPVRQFIPA